MRTLAFVTQKGGSGKSTLASSIAVAAYEQGEKVCLIDLDPQGTLTNWAKARGSDEIPVIAASAGKLHSLVEGLEGKGFTLAVLDTPGAEGPAAAAAMKAADLCVIPSRPSMFDLWASAYTRKTLQSVGGEYAFLLNQCPPAQQTARIEDGVNSLEELGALLSPLVQSRVDYQEAGRRGWGVTELNPHGAAAEEMRALWASLKRRIAKLKAKGAARRAA